MTTDRLRVGTTPAKGRGVFAAAAFAPGDLVASAPTIEMTAHDTDVLPGTVLDDYYFAHPQDEAGGLFVLGLAALCNHSDDPNVDTEVASTGDCGLVVHLRARCAIDPGEEITRRYACPPWFEVDS